MKKILILLLALLMVFALAACTSDEKTAESSIESSTDGTGEQDQPGDQLGIDITEDFTVYDANGDEITLHEKIGSKPIVVNLWGVWCNPCVSELPAFQSLYMEYGEEIEFMMVHNDGGYRVKDDDISALITENAYTFPVYYDLDYSVSNAYSISGFPTSLFITADGELMDTHQGMMNEEQLREYLEDLLAE